ncbi:hypothetical protein P5G65_24165 [Paenibacillus chondroitinus]|uniref:YopA central domain-containing protein n=1 Tax=Paenibacillus chondroitinus TaxID=59842 RepID=A0ABU6DI08_9BACL|nr:MULTISPECIES: hypothetical protein [Paenibacillus]MCY9659604.1 hypothetical protein [Paenibacillus anseongense]MEB4797000.1 hypothetical protein [Paenibacillus chondroitinus]
MLRLSGASIHYHSDAFHNSDNMEQNKVKIKISGYIVEDVVISEIRPSVSGSINIKGEILSSTLKEKSKKVTYIKCGITNLINTYGGQIVKYKEGEVRNRFKLSIDGWDITIDKRPDYREKKIYETLKSTGGYAITHLCQIRREDRQAFGTNDISDLEEAMHWALSFVTGRHIGICYLEGFHDNGEVVWRKYQTPSIDKWRYRKTWFPRMDERALSEIFQLIYTKLQDVYWKKVLTNVFSWYLECHSDGIIENKIVSNQIALETLAWSYLVEDKGILQEQEYGKKRASDIFRLFFQQFILNTTIPSDFPYIEEVQKLKYYDSAHLITDYRNNVVHPKKKVIFQPLPNDFSFFVLRLGLHYFELGLLFIMGYKGRYLNQLYFGWDG